MLRICVVVNILFAQASAPATDKAATSNVVAKMQKFYETTKDLHAHFDQTLESAVKGASRASGDLWLKKPGKMRWDYAKPEPKVMVSDGQTLWVYEPEDEQAFKQDVRSSTLPVSVGFLFGQGKLSDEFDISIVKPDGIGQPGDVVLKLIPKVATAAYRYLLFVTDSKTGLVRQTIIYDQQSGVNKLSFSAVETNRGVDDSKFKFTPPSGTRILSPPR